LQVAERGPQLRHAAAAELPAHEPVEVGEHCGCDGLEPTRSPRQEDERRTCICGIRPALDQAVAFKPADHLRHRLLAESRAPGELAHP
jgi:hypothetical protein